MGTPTKVGNRNSRGGAIRGITACGPLGWSAPEATERLASFAKAQGWQVVSEWFEAEGRVCLRVEIGRVLAPGEIKTAKGDRWIYRLVWEEIPEEERPNLHHSRMKIAVNRSLTPGSNTWRDGPSLKMITDLIRRNPASQRPQKAIQAIKMQAKARTMAL